MYATVNTIFSNWLLSVIEVKGLSQAELSRRGGISPAAISDVISGRRNPGTEFCTGIAKALQLPVEEVLRVAGILPPEPDKDEKFYRIENLYHTLREEGNKQRALEFMEFLSTQEDKNDRKGKKSK